ARVQHPIPTVRLPYSGLAQAVFIECSIGPKLKNWIRTEFFPLHTVARPCHTEPLAPRAILPEIVHKVEIAHAQDVWIGHAALIPAPARTGLEHRPRAFAPLLDIGRLCQSDLRRLSPASLIPVEKFALMSQRRSVRSDVGALPGL